MYFRPAVPDAATHLFCRDRSPAAVPAPAQKAQLAKLAATVCIVLRWRNFMKPKAVNAFDILIASINYVVISYALSNMAMLFRFNLLFVLFFASEIWVAGNYWNRISSVIQNRWISSALLALCFIAHIVVLYFGGHVVGALIPF